MSALPSPTPAGDGHLLALLATGHVELLARFESSNLALFVEVSDGDEAIAAVYKPEAGERPLWDFDPGLHRRERAAYVLSEWLGWGLVPPTVVREDGPLGVGSVQLYIEADETEHFFTLDLRDPEVLATVQAMAVFDVVANNADRKGGHLLRDPCGRIWGIDHGLCFATPNKLRTVIWDFSDEPIPAGLLEDLAPLADEVPGELTTLLDTEEVDLIRTRARRLLHLGRFPSDPSGRRVPWPLV